MERVKIIECPRDAWQGLPQVIPTELKAEYLARLVAAGFRHIDAVSFVSPKHVKQMADSEEVMEKLMTLLGAKGVGQETSEERKIQRRGHGGEEEDAEKREKTTGGTPALQITQEMKSGDVKSPLQPEIIGVVVNEKGLERALRTPGVTTVGYPYSISAYFRRANANMSRGESRSLVETLARETKAAGRGFVVYISMAFGNPYEEPWGPEIVEETIEWLREVGVKTVSLADTVGTAKAEEVGSLYRAVRDAARGMELGVHLHSRPEGAAEKVLAAYEAGCRRFDSALTGLGGCPFAGDDLVGNIATETVVATLEKKGVATGLQASGLGELLKMSNQIRAMYEHALATDTVQ